MRLIVCICTHNRAALLRQTLSRITEIERPIACDWELLVVDNASTDGSAQVAQEFEDRLPLSLIREPKLGLSNARNAAIDEAVARKADYMIWTDDDVLPDRLWLREYEAAFVKYPEVGILGGTVRPWFESQPPAWLHRNWAVFKNAFAVRELGDAEFELKPDSVELPFGANFCVRVADQQTARYDPGLGVIGNKRLRGEESVVLEALLRQGHRGWWLPRAAVEHFLPTSRLSIEYLTQYYRGAGETEAILRGWADRPPYRRPRWIWRMYLQSLLFCCVASVLGRGAFWARHFRVARTCEGRLFAS